jgi:heme/copper-type cytochrome/quinol oxidase subunit 2
MVIARIAMMIVVVMVVVVMRHRRRADCAKTQRQEKRFSDLHPVTPYESLLRMCFGNATGG